MSNLKAPSGLKSDYYFALHKKLKAAGINIPFPQRELHLQSITPQLRQELKSLMDPETATTAAPLTDGKNEAE
jgi:small-conductance mechanosensitive channel